MYATRDALTYIAHTIRASIFPSRTTFIKICQSNGYVIAIQQVGCDLLTGQALPIGCDGQKAG